VPGALDLSCVKGRRGALRPRPRLTAAAPPGLATIRGSLGPSARGPAGERRRVRCRPERKSGVRAPPDRRARDQRGVESRPTHLIRCGDMGGVRRDHRPSSSKPGRSPPALRDRRGSTVRSLLRLGSVPGHSRGGRHPPRRLPTRSPVALPRPTSGRPQIWRWRALIRNRRTTAPSRVGPRRPTGRACPPTVPGSRTGTTPRSSGR
jgi:hypothetical protein